MSRSTKKHPACKINPGSQKKGKQLSHRLFRQCERMAIRTNIIRNLPYKQWQLVDPWDLIDGRIYFGNWPKEEYNTLIRK